MHLCCFVVWLYREGSLKTFPAAAFVLSFKPPVSGRFLFVGWGEGFARFEAVFDGGRA